MAKLTLLDIVSGYAVVSTYNTNNTAIETAIENTLSRDGTAPNAMSAELDMGSHLIRNLADGTLSADAVNLRQLQATAGTAAAFPSQTGNANKVLKTDGTVVAWQSPQDIADSFTPTGTIAATTLQTAIAELDTDTQSALALKAPLASPTFTGIVTTAGQIAFPAVANPSADVNTLDDYEEGTWLPSIGGNATYTSRSGEYIKIGKFVFIHGKFQINVLGTGSTSQVSDIPFATAYTGSMCVSSFLGLATAIVNPVGALTIASVINFTGNAAAATLSGTVTNLFQNGSFFEFSGWYISTT